MKYDCKSLTNDQSLIEALQRMGWTTDQIEVHQKPVHLYGYHGDIRPEVANIVIRRNNVGGSSNDLGFVKLDDGSYQPIVSEFDTKVAGPHKRNTEDTFVQTVERNYTRITGEKSVATLVNRTIPRAQKLGVVARTASVKTVTVGNTVKVVLKYD